MSIVRVALANLKIPASREESVVLAEDAVADASEVGAVIVCFPECFIPGYRVPGRSMPPPDPVFLEHAWTRVAEAAKKAKISVVLGTERVEAGSVFIAALVIHADGSRAGFQDKAQLDPAEEGMFVAAASGRKIFQCGSLTFGIAICHEGFRYPETVRSVVRQGGQLVFHPHFSWAEPGSYRPTTYADPANTFHEKAALCRAAENTSFYATVNCASDGSPTTSAFVRPDGTLLAHQPYGKEGLLVADLDLTEATGLLAARLK